MKDEKKPCYLHEGRKCPLKEDKNGKWYIRCFACPRAAEEEKWISAKDATNPAN